jgi:four helix bundle protein
LRNAPVEKMNRFKNLIVYEKALDFSFQVRRCVRKFPKDELFGLTSQFRRAADSIVLNISEGAGNSSKLEYARFLDIAIRSAFESLACLDIALRNEFLSQTDYDAFSRQTNEIIAMVYGLKKSLKK